VRLLFVLFLLVGCSSTNVPSISYGMWSGLVFEGDVYQGELFVNYGKGVWSFCLFRDCVYGETNDWDLVQDDVVVFRIREDGNTLTIKSGGSGVLSPVNSLGIDDVEP